jgi:hypothetical protein
MRKTIVTGLAALAIAASVPAAMAASGPGGGGGEVRRKGSCSGASDWEMRIEDRGSFRVRWDVDSGIPGQSWTMSVSRNGSVIGSGTRVTNDRGEAEFRLRGVANPAGRDTFTGTATNPATGETCSGSASIG